VVDIDVIMKRQISSLLSANAYEARDQTDKVGRTHGVEITIFADSHLFLQHTGFTGYPNMRGWIPCTACSFETIRIAELV
jgi:hypothetical protein